MVYIRGTGNGTSVPEHMYRRFTAAFTTSTCVFRCDVTNIRFHPLKFPYGELISGWINKSE